LAAFRKMRALAGAGRRMIDGAPVKEAVRMAAGKGSENQPGLTAPGPGAVAPAGPSIGRWLRAQLLAGAGLALALIPLGAVAAYSSMFGSLAAFTPALFFAVFAGRRIGSDSAAFLQAAVVGEALKLLLTALICMAVFIWIEPLAAGWFFAGMILVIVAGWIGLFKGLNSGD
jgi:ATP synthase protein I